MEFLFRLPLSIQLLLIYMLLINLLTFFYFGLDKLKAQLGTRRIHESLLWLLALVGGSLGGLLGMHFFRHKTQKISFQAVLAVILAAQLVTVVWYFSG